MPPKGTLGQATRISLQPLCRSWNSPLLSLFWSWWNGRLNRLLGGSSSPTGAAHWSDGGSKVGGYPDWIHFARYPRCKCGAAMELLVHFGSGEFDYVNWGRWMPIEERGLLTPGNKEVGTTMSAARWCFGAMGVLYLFICRQCTGLPTTYDVQTS